MSNHIKRGNFYTDYEGRVWFCDECGLAVSSAFYHSNFWPEWKVRPATKEEIDNFCERLSAFIRSGGNTTTEAMAWLKKYERKQIRPSSTTLPAVLTPTAQ
jgi:hypothetical protein